MEQAFKGYSLVYFGSIFLDFHELYRLFFVTDGLGFGNFCLTALRESNFIGNIFVLYSYGYSTSVLTNYEILQTFNFNWEFLVLFDKGANFMLIKVDNFI